MRFRIGTREYSAEEAEREVARLRSLPDAEIAALKRSGQLDAWYIACGIAEPQVAGAHAWKAPAESAPPAQTSQAPAAPAQPAPRKPVYRKKLSAEQHSEIETRWDKAHESLDVDQLAAMHTSPELAQYRLDMASDMVPDEVKSPRGAVFYALVYALTFKDTAAVRIAELEKRIAELEARPQVRYLGSYTEGFDYPPGSLVSHGGSMWHANFATRERPGGSSAAWTLAVKKGNDGRDAR